ncbi:MAG: hypothetical protein U9R38_02390 [Candidatus Margulisiibacteriota bacterium]|nr:hypothetical protein [Candidatus Margulisiibacteriota bacterium]
MIGDVYSGALSALQVDGYQINSTVTRDKVADFYRGFRGELTNLMKDLVNEESDLNFGQYHFTADQKNGIAANTAMTMWQEEQGLIFNNLLDALKHDMTLQRQVNNMFS